MRTADQSKNYKNYSIIYTVPYIYKKAFGDDVVSFVTSYYCFFA